MAKITVLGSGMVGSAIAIEMAKLHEVLLVDINEKSLHKVQKRKPEIHISVADLSNIDNLQKACSDADLVFGAVPGFMGYQLLEHLIDLKKDVVDISFCPENALALNQKAKEAGVSIFVDAGVAPGLDNLILGYHNEYLNIGSFKCMVGGLPKERQEPWEYKAPFSPIDVIEEYIRPARLVKDGTQLIVDPLSEIETLYFQDLELEAFNSDGLRTLVDHFPNIPNMVEKTIRYPGHANKVLHLKKSGFFSNELIDLNGAKIQAIDFTAKILLDAWKSRIDEDEFTLMTIDIKGTYKENSNPIHIHYEIYDEYNQPESISSMARTTGYTACATAEYFLNKGFEQKGIIPLELLGKQQEAFNYIIQFLKKKDIQINMKTTI